MKRILYADILRIITIFAMILFHVCTNERWWISFDNPSEWYVLNFFVAGLRWCVPIFFMLSGINFLDPNRNITYKKLFTKYIPHILCALIFWSIFYKGSAVITNYLLGLKPITTESIIAVFTTFVFQIPWFHLWFLYFLIAIYLMTPIFRVFTKNASKQDYIYLLGLYFIFAWLLPVIFFYVGQGINFGIQELAPMTGFFFAGYFFAKYDLTPKQTNILYSLGIIAFILTVGGHIILSLLNGGTMYHQFFEYSSFNISLIAFFIFVFTKNKINNSSFENKYQGNKYITKLSECSFGIYLTHAIFLNVVIGILKIDTTILPAIISVPMITILVYSLSLGLTLIIKQIPILNKWII